MQWMLHKAKVGGGFTHVPEEMETALSEEARKFIQDNFADIDPESGVWDHHCHVAGFGHQGTGCFLNTTMMSAKKAGGPVQKVKYFVFISAALDPEETATKEKRDLNRFASERIIDFDGKYIKRLSRLVRSIPGHWGKQFLLAMDCWHDHDGTRRMDKTGMYVPNEYVINLAAEYPDVFAPAISVHPYRPDALDELERCAKAGARLIKWLPNSMGIDPSDEKCIPFYDKMVELGMVLLSHTGKEHTVDGGELLQMFGNPLLLRRPLDRGVRVIAAHCSSRGIAMDLDDPQRRKVACLDLFFRLMDEEKYKDLFFADISALTSFKRVAKSLPAILNRTDIHHRLLNGSDYPLPAINVIVRTRKLMKKGLITKEERRLLKEIYLYNPLLYDYLIKRRVKSKEGNRFPASIFMKNPLLDIYDTKIIPFRSWTNRTESREEEEYSERDSDHHRRHHSHDENRSSLMRSNGKRYEVQAGSHKRSRAADDGEKEKEREKEKEKGPEHPGHRRHHSHDGNSSRSRLNEKEPARSHRPRGLTMDHGHDTKDTVKHHHRPKGESHLPHSDEKEHHAYLNLLQHPFHLLHRRHKEDDVEEGNGSADHENRYGEDLSRLSIRGSRQSLD